MNAYRPLVTPSSPVQPTWHPPAMELSVNYPSPQVYGRRKDASVYGSFSVAPWANEDFGAEDDLGPAPTKTKVKSISQKSPGEQIKNLFRKDETGTSKAGRIAKRAAEIAKGKAAVQAAPRAERVIVHVPAPAPAPSGMPGMVQLALVGVVAAGLGFGAGYLLGHR